MSRKDTSPFEIKLDAVVGGGQTIGTHPDGRKVFVWGGLPGETVQVQPTKIRSRLIEGYVLSVSSPSDERVEPSDPDSYLSTSPWQIMSFTAEQHYKSCLIEEAFELHDIVLPNPIEIYSDDNIYGYRNKMEYSFWWDKDTDQLSLAFFKRGSHSKIAVSGTSIGSPAIEQAAAKLIAVLNDRQAAGFDLKTAILRSTSAGDVVMQLYVKTTEFNLLSDDEFRQLGVAGFELIYSDPQSPASKISERLQSLGDITLMDKIFDVPFYYAAESFFQVNLPVYEQALTDMRDWVPAGKKVLDLYSGVGSIGLTIGGDDCTLVEINESAVREMKRNIKQLGIKATAILSPSEAVIDTITGDETIIVDPPRAGLHKDLIESLRDKKPSRIIYLSCNPVTQARDVAMLCADEAYGIAHHAGYNFFPRTPHIEHLVVLEAKN